MVHLSRVDAGNESISRSSDGMDVKLTLDSLPVKACKLNCLTMRTPYSYLKCPFHGIDSLIPRSHVYPQVYLRHALAIGELASFSKAHHTQDSGAP